MCKQFFDIRTFGAVMSTSDKVEKEGEDESSKIKKTAGQVRGPVQITFARSVDPIVALEHSISVCAARKADKSVESQIGIQGRKNTVPYGIYIAHGFVSAHLANQTGFTECDLELLWNALVNMFEHDRSAARGLMATRGLIVFRHDTALGNAPAHKLFELIQVKRKTDTAMPAREFGDYEITIDRAQIPAGVTLDVKG
jgi:CRISPR-associated protein Csd2